MSPIEFAEFGHMVAVRCPQEFAHILNRASGMWDGWQPSLAGDPAPHRAGNPRAGARN
jgi:hypothetical protein